MRNSIYDALEISASSSVAAIQAAVRTVVRRFWAVPRDASGDSEEAVRFAALAASILGDAVRRKDYDVALNPGVGSGPWRLPIGNREASPGEGSTNSRVLGDNAEVSQLSIDASPPKALPGVDALAEPLPDGKAWQSPLIWGALGAALLLLWFGCAQLLGVALRWSVMQALVVAVALTAVLFASALWIGRAREPVPAAASLSRLAIIKWRREGSIFIGMPAPQHDTAWIFKLRLMELTRTAAGFVTATNPWRRLVARLVDYALVALIAYGLVAIAESVAPTAAVWFGVLRSPVFFPVLVVALAVPYEAMWLRVARTTPGKWLLGMVVVIAASRPADQVMPGNVQLGWRRSLRVAWSGATMGVWPIAAVRLATQLRAARDRETDWDASGDSIVMARSLTASAVATALGVLVATSLIVAAAWYRDFNLFGPQLTTAVTHAGAGLFRLVDGERKPQPNALPVSGEARVAEPAQPATTSAPNNVDVAPRPPVVAAAPAKPAKNTVAETEMEKQASAAHARRVRIDGYARQAEAARRSGNYGGLQSACQQWTQEQPGSAEAWRCYGLAQQQNGAGRDALPALRQALKLEPKDSQVEAAILRILRP